MVQTLKMEKLFNGLSPPLTMKCGGEIERYLMSIYCYNIRNIEKANAMKIIT